MRFLLRIFPAADVYNVGIVRHCRRKKGEHEKMELKLFRDTLPAAGGSYTLKAEIPVETEILISDYLPQIFKIVKCFVHPVILQKQLQPGRMTLEGYIRCIVFYQGEDGRGLCQTEQKLPFSRALEVPAFEFSTWTATAEGETEYLNCRAVNPRRIELRGAFGLCVSIYPQRKTEIVTALADGGVEQQQCTLSGMRSTAVLDKLVTADASIHFDAVPEAVLDITGTGAVRELKLLNGKAVVKGEIKAQCVWRAAGEQQLQARSAAIPFQQVIDLEGITEDCRCLCVIEPVGFTMTQGESGSPEMISASALLHLRAWRGYELRCVTDAFSTRCGMELEKQLLSTSQLACMLDETVTVTGGGTLPDADTKLLACFAAFGAVEIVPRVESPCLTVHGVITAFGENSLGEIESYERPAELALPLRLPVGTDCAALCPECWLSVEDIACTCAGGTLEAAVRVKLEGVVMQQNTVSAVASAVLGEPLEQPEPDVALRIFYAQAGEELFDIAKRFHVSPGAMLRANGLHEGEQTLASACRLLVPGV